MENLLNFLRCRYFVVMAWVNGCLRTANGRVWMLCAQCVKSASKEGVFHRLAFAPDTMRPYSMGRIRGPKGSGGAWGPGKMRIPMIELVASDMDGTLLDEHSRVPAETYDIIRRLNAAGVRFVAASGRRYDTLREFFEPVADSMDFVASNGAQVVVGGTLVDREVFSYAALKRLLGVVRMFDCLHLVVYDRTNSYLLSDPSSFECEFDKDLPNPVAVDELPSAETSIVKASIFCEDALMDMAYVLTRELDDDFVFAPSGKKWIDVMQRGVNKATGISQVLDAYGIAPERVLAFGDSMNDYEILRMVGESRAMANGRSAVKQISKKTIGTNAEHAVQAELRGMLEELEG